MATVYQISSSDSGSAAAQKINESVSNLNAAIGSGGGGSTPSGIIALNESAKQRISAAKQHFDERTNTSGYSTNTQANCFIIAHGSDFHNDAARYGRFRDFIDGVTSIDAAIVTGDLTDKGKDAEFAAMSAISFTRITPMQVIGNHERQDGKTIAAIGEALGQPKVSNAYKGYFYKDFSTPKIRVIVLNEYDTSTTTASTAQKDGHWSQDQIDWFISALDGAISSGYSVMVAMHCMEQGSASIAMPTDNDKGFYQRNNQWKNLLTTVMPHYLIEDIIAAFRSGGTISGTYAHSDGTTSISVSHSFSSAGKFVAYIVGHSHIDMTGYSQEHPDQLYLVCPNSCVWGGASGTSSSHRFFGGEVSDLPRIEGMKCEDCFNIYGIDTVNEVVKIIRVGADMNDLMEPREVACFEYEPTVGS